MITIFCLAIYHVQGIPEFLIFIPDIIYCCYNHLYNILDAPVVQWLS